MHYIGYWSMSGSPSSPFDSGNSNAGDGSAEFPYFHKDYRVLTMIHNSGMGRLYKAVHTPSGQIVILKTLLVKTGQANESSLKRFEREAKALAQFKHPNIVGILDFQLEGRNPFIAMEYIQGETLRDYIKRFPKGMPEDRFFRLMSQICGAVNLIHDHGIIHRDLKPKNMMVQATKGGILLKILDFGLILFDRFAFPEGGQGLTLKSEIIGAPAYMSPEQCVGARVTHLTDIYNLGLIAFEMVAGAHPFSGKTLQDLMNHHVHVKPRVLKELRPELSDSISNAVARALAKNPDERFFSTRAFWLALKGENKKS